MELGETILVIPFDCPNINKLQNSLDMVAMNYSEYNKIAQENKDWKILIEESQNEVNLLT